MEFPLLKQIFIIFALAVAVTWVATRIRIPTIVGLILTGVIAGPYGLRLITAVEEVEMLAELGVIFLLFAIGLEFSIQAVRHVRRLFLVAGPLQVLLTTLSIFGLSLAMGAALERALLFGMVASLSSTAIILRLLQERSELTSPQGKGTMAILIFQDLVFVLMMLLIPLMAGTEEHVSWRQVLWRVLEAGGILAAVLFLAPRIVPRLMTSIARTGSNELFVLSTGVLCFAVAYLTSLVGLSLALGAFLAGLILADSEHSHRTLENVLPFRDVFSSFFFVSTGMLLDGRYFVAHAPLVLTAALVVIVLKMVIGTGVMVGVGLPYRVASLTGLALAQAGEFSILLLAAGLHSGVLENDDYQFALAVCLITMGIAPFIVKASRQLVDLGAKLPMPTKLREGRYFIAGDADEAVVDHIIVVGYGVIGAMVGHSAKLCDIPYEAIEINYDMVHEQRARGVPIFYGDATQEASLVKANIAKARICVVAIPDPNGTARVVALARRLNPQVEIVARVRYVRDMARLYALGADEVVSEETEASIKIFSMVLEKYGVAPEVIEGFGGVTRPRS